MTYQLPFDSKDDPRWKLLEATRARLVTARGQDEIIEIVRSSARSVVSADGVTFVLREYSHCHYVEEDAIAPAVEGAEVPHDQLHLRLGDDELQDRRDPGHFQGRAHSP